MNEVKKPSRPKTITDRLGAFVDGVVSVFNPVAGAKRTQFRERYATLKAAAADLEDKRNRGGNDETRAGKWMGSKLSPDGEAARSLADARDKSRELYHHDSMGGVVESRTNLVVSYGFTPQARIGERKGLVSQSQADTWNQELEDVYTRTSPAICVTGKRSLWQLLRIAENHHGFDGESLTILHAINGAGLPIPLRMEVVDPMRLETPPEKTGNPNIRLGIEYKGKEIVAYWIRDSHPSDTSNGSPQTFTRYEASRVLHVFEAMQAEQTRGLPWLIRALNRIKDVGDLDEASLIAAQVEACFAAFVTTEYGDGETQAGKNATGTSADGHRLQEIIPGGIHYQSEGNKVSFATPTKSNGYTGIQEWNHRKIATAINYPYEMTTKNWAGLSFAAGRLSLAEARQFCKGKQQYLREMWLCKVWERMVWEAVNVAKPGVCTIPPATYFEAPWWFHKHEWTAPAWPFALTPMEEVNAKIKLVDENIIPKASVSAEYGFDSKEVMKLRKVERETERTNNIDPASSEVPAETLAAQQHQMNQELAA